MRIIWKLAAVLTVIVSGPAAAETWRGDVGQREDPAPGNLQRLSRMLVASDAGEVTIPGSHPR
jgi:hypothetical protein